MQDQDSQTTGIEFLESLEQRHKQVLDGLDELNRRIESVLAEHLPKRAKDEQNAPAAPAAD